MFYYAMSAEKITAKELNHAPLVRSMTKNVNINQLKANLRGEQKKEQNGNYIFLSLVILVIASIGFLASF